MSFDWRHLPAHLVYNEHYKLAIYVAPSRCRESICDDDLGGRSRSCCQSNELDTDIIG